MLRSQKTGEPATNRLLAALPGKEYQRLRPHLEEVTLTFGEVLYESGEIIRRVYLRNYDALFGHRIRSTKSAVTPAKIKLSWKIPMRVFIRAPPFLR